MCETHLIKVWILHSGDTTGFSCGSKSQQQLALFFVSVLPKVFKYGHLRPCRQPVKYRQHVTLLIWTLRPQHVLCRDKGASLRAALRGEERREEKQFSSPKGKKGLIPRASEGLNILWTVFLGAVSACPSLHRCTVACLHSGPADLQPGQLGTVLEELLDGNVPHVQLGRQRVLLLHGSGQLLKHFYRWGRKESSAHGEDRKITSYSST